MDVNAVVFLALQEMMVFAMKKLGFSPDFPVTAWISVGCIGPDEACYEPANIGGPFLCQNRVLGFCWMCKWNMYPVFGHFMGNMIIKYEFHSWLSL